MTPTNDVEKPHTAHHGHGRWPFARPYLEMVAAMFVGMAVLGALVRGALALAGLETPDQPELLSLEMAFDMAVGMFVWMRYRGHGWAGTLEMAGAMFAPALVLFPLLWVGAIGGDDLLVFEHVLMLLVMYLVMRRRRSEYGAADAGSGDRSPAAVGEPAAAVVD